MDSATDNLSGKSIIVTGATGAIGSALCRALAARGCRLGLLARTVEKLRALASDLTARGAAVSFQTADLGERARVQQAIAALREELGGLDVLIHNAGIGRLTRPAAVQVADVEEMLAVNYFGGVYCVEAVLPAMLAQGSGQIVAVSSLAALRGLAWSAGYSATKAAFATFLESLRPALRLRGVYATTCYLGFVRSPLAASVGVRSSLWMISPEAAAKQILRATLRRRREAYFPWYDALGARLLRRLPPWAFDAVTARFGPLLIKEQL